MFIVNDNMQCLCMFAVYQMNMQRCLLVRVEYGPVFVALRFPVFSDFSNIND